MFPKRLTRFINLRFRLDDPPFDILTGFSTVSNRSAMFFYEPSVIAYPVVVEICQSKAISATAIRCHFYRNFITRSGPSFVWLPDAKAPTGAILIGAGNAVSETGTNGAAPENKLTTMF